MKSIYPYALLGALFAVGAASAATTTTTPVGYVSLGDTTAGQPAVKANTDSIISIPLARESDFTGTAASVAGNVVTIAGTPAWTATQFTATPYYFVVTGGAQQGLIGLVTANTTNTVTVSTVAGSLAGVDATSTVVLTKAWT
ncbi:MAG: hypothetical protein JWO82_3260, partial [Akkermansiaceae bacterium]|nr:hypothetical protein [Akkermansiaceae bacterium]